MERSRHLCRLAQTWDQYPLYFITTCVLGRRPILANTGIHEILRDEWIGVKRRHGWMIGRYVIMPDHVHFFVAPYMDTPVTLSSAIGRWKQWTAKRILQLEGKSGPLWQKEFFDHLLRSSESRSEKWDYVRDNPVRAGLVTTADQWPYAGAIDFE